MLYYIILYYYCVILLKLPSKVNHRPVPCWLIISSGLNVMPCTVTRRRNLTQTQHWHFALCINCALPNSKIRQDYFLRMQRQGETETDVKRLFNSYSKAPLQWVRIWNAVISTLESSVQIHTGPTHSAIKMAYFFRLIQDTRYKISSRTFWFWFSI